jgi:hypothetical protein
LTTSCKNTREESEKDEGKAWRGGWSILMLTIAASLALGLALVDLGGDLILDTLKSDRHEAAGQTVNYHTTSMTVQEQLLAIVVLGGALLAFIGTTLRAFAHNVSDRKNYDYAGKLLAVAALMFTLTGAMSAIDPGLRNAVVTTFVLLIVGTACAIAVIAALVIGEREYRRSR